MSEYLVKGETLTALADSIRAKTGSTEEMVFPDGFKDAIAGISSESYGGPKAAIYVSGNDYETFAVGDESLTYYKIHNESPTLDQLIGGVYSEFNSNGSASVPMVAEIFDIDGWGEQEDGGVLLNGRVVSISEANAIAVGLPSGGMWYQADPDISCLCIAWGAL